MARTAKKTIASYELECPHCATTLFSPQESVFWTVNEIEVHSSGAVKCSNCEASIKLPKT